jgi:hypothetical protein
MFILSTLSTLNLKCFPSILNSTDNHFYKINTLRPMFSFITGMSNGNYERIGVNRVLFSRMTAIRSKKTLSFSIRYVN